MKKKILGILVILFLCKNLGALNVFITNDVADMVSAKKICMRLHFDPYDAAVYKDAFCVSIDTPGLVLKGWRTSARSFSTYIPSFRKVKTIFNESFNVEALIDFEVDNRQKQIDLLNQAHVSVATLLLTTDGKNKGENVIVSLNADARGNLTLTGTSLGLFSSHLTTTLMPYQQSFEVFNRSQQLKSKNKIDEVLIINRTRDLDSVLHKKLREIFGKFSFYRWYISLLLLFMVLLLRSHLTFMTKFLPARFYYQLLLFLGMVVSLLSWGLLKNIVVLRIWYSGLGIFCLPFACYYLCGDSRTFGGRLKILIGIMLATALVPLFALAYIHTVIK